ncbi:MAG: fimbrial protein FimV [Burkholderiaceae bacterium]|nr:fimbrial protein FimV [Burkholderiaceae bacterium]
MPDISSEEAATFQATLGTQQEFQAAGVNYSQALRGTRITLNHRPNGQAYLRVEGQQPVNEPFLNVVIDANWAKGHVVRNYTLLIDPPHQQAAASAEPSAKQGNTPVVTGTATPKYRPVYPEEGSETAAASGAASTVGEGHQVQVQPGDTATAIVSAHQAENVSLDQMLIALLRANPDAFIHGNVNLIRAGAVVNMPSADQAAAVSPASAHRMVIAQSRNFHAYRQGLAMTATRGSRITAGRRSAAGGVQPQVQEIGAAPPPSDRLTLSHGQSAGKTSNETNVAQKRQEQYLTARAQELRNNINKLEKLKGNIPVPPATPASSIKLPVPSINLPASRATSPASSPQLPASMPVPSPQLPASALAPLSQTASPASAPASQSRPAPLHRALPPPPESSFMDTLTDPLTLGGAAAVILLLVGYGWYRSKQNRGPGRNEPKLDSDLYSEDKLPPDSYFGASGGQRVDTNSDSSGVGENSSMAYSPSQLEAVGDIDPVSEADVYLAYGRDAQAEEILKEALRTYPGRASIYAKLAEIYAKQRDTHQLEAIATEARRVTHGEGSDWQAIVSLGKDLDPANPLYASGTASPQSDKASAAPEARSNAPSSSSEHALDLSLAATSPPSPASRPQPVPPTAPVGENPHMTIDFARMSPARALDTAATEPLPLISERAGNASSAPLYTGNIDFTPPIQPPSAYGPSNSGMMEFDVGALSPSPALHSTQASASPADDDPLVTKLALAQEFHAIGDTSSARSLAKEVIAEATGALKTKAEQFLNSLD